MVATPGPVITVLIPTYNRVAMLPRAVESVLGETRVPITLRIFDNASTDGTEAYVRELMKSDDRVEYVRHETNIGAVPNFITAFASVDSDYFVPLADDDYLCPDFLHDAHGMLGQHPDAAAAVFAAEARDEEGVTGLYPVDPGTMPEGYTDAATHMRHWLASGHYHWSSVLWRSSILEFLGEPYFHTGVPDVDLEAQVFCRHPVVASHKIASVYWAHADQMSQDFGPHSPDLFREVFERIDDVVRAEGLFGAQEYQGLRDRAMRRYRGSVRNSDFSQLTRDQRLAAAEVAGFELGDWRTAQDLLDNDEPPKPDDAAWRMQYFPGLSHTDEPELYRFASGEEHATLLRWLVASTHQTDTWNEQLKSWLERNHEWHTQHEAMLKDRDAMAKEKAALVEQVHEQQQLIAEREIKLERLRAKHAETRRALRRERRRNKKLVAAREELLSSLSWRIGQRIVRLLKPFRSLAGR